MPVRSFFVIQLVLWCSAAGVAAGQEGAANDPGAAQTEGRAELTAEESRLAGGSRAAIIAAGLSPEFFDAHFRLVQVSDRPADRRVVWRLKVGEHEAVVNDPVGSYTDEKGVRRDAHSVGNLLRPAHDLRKTITRRRAERLMRACIGEYRDGAVVYQPFGSPPRATLVFTAMSVPAPPPPAAQATAPPKQDAPPPPGETGAAVTTPRSEKLRQGGRKRPPPRVGMLDLETGRCIVGVAQSGSPHPDAEKLTRPPR